MEPISIIIMALVAGAAAAIKPTTEQAIKDAYAGIKSLIQRKYANVNIPMLEADPTNESRQDVIKQDLKKTVIGQDEEVLYKAKAILDAIQTHSPAVLPSIGLDLKDIKGASLTAERILAEGSSATGVKGVGFDISGDIRISDVTTRSGEDTSQKKAQSPQ